MGYLNNSGLSHFWDKLKQFFVKKSEVENAGISSISYTTVLASTTVTTALATGYRYPSAVLSSSVPSGFSQAHLYRITISNAEKRMPCVLWYRKNNAGTGIQPIEFIGNPSYMLAEDVTSYFGHGDVDTTCGFCISARDIANDGARKLMLFTPTSGSYTVKIELENRDVTKFPPDLTFDNYNNPISEVANPNKSNSVSVGSNYMKHKTGTTSVGSGNTNSGANSTSVGVFNEASGQLSVAVGTQNKASGMYSLAVGNSNQSTGPASSAFGYFTESSGAFSTTNGQRTIANHKSQFVFGELNEPDPSEEAASARGTYVEIVGNGTSPALADRSNARTLDWDGNERLAGSLTLAAGSEDEETLTAPKLSNISKGTCEFINGTQTAATGSFTGVSRDSSLYDGKHIIYRLPYAGSGNATLNLTLADGTTTGAKNVWRSPGTRLTTHYAAGNFIGMTYYQSDDSWHCDVDVDTDSYAYGVRLYYGIYKTQTALYRYQIVLTRDENTLLPVNAVSNNTGTTKQLTTDEFDPFGEIYWYWTTTTISAGSYITGSNLFSQYWLVDLRYSFNTGTTLTAYKDVYLVCEPRSNGKVVLAPNPISQTLPSSEDGYVYIRLGKAYDTYQITLDLYKPRYYYTNGEIREWTNAPVDAKLAEYNTDEDVFQIRHAKAEKQSYNSEVVRKITGGTLAWNQLLYNFRTNACTATTNDGVVTITPTNSSNRYIGEDANGRPTISVIGGHKYLQSVVIKSDGEHYVGFQNHLRLDIYTKTKAATWTELSAISNATTSGDSVIQLYSSSNTEYQIKEGSFNLFDLTQTFGSAIADRIYALEQATAGAGVAWFRRYFNLSYYAPAQTLAHTYFDEYDTTGFNLLDIDSLYDQNAWILNGSKLTNKIADTRTNAQISVQAIDIDGNFITNLAYTNITSTGRFNVVFAYNDSSIYRIRIKHNGSTRDMYICNIYGSSLVIKNSYCLSFTVESNNPTTVGGLIISDICINLSDASRNGQYEPYRHSRITFFDNPVLLRGIPYLDENDNLRFNGDTLEANGKLTRRYGIVDLGTLNWGMTSETYPRFRAVLNAKPTNNSVLANGVCGKYIMLSATTTYIGYVGISINDEGDIRIYDPTYTTVTEFKTAMSGVYLVYELKTPTEEEFTPIDGPLVSDPLGLEVISRSDWDDTPILAQMDILYANEVRANVEMIATNKVIASQNSAKDLSKCITVKPGKLLANGTDLNTVKTFGEYYLQGPDTMYSYTNAAFSGNSKLLVIDMQGSDYDGPMYNGGVMQIQIGEIYDSTTGVRTNKAYSRIYYSGTTWSSWKPIQGGSGLFYGSSATAAGTATKDVVCPEFTAVDLVPGTTISVKFDNTNSAAVGSLALNVNGTGAHNVKYVYNGSYSNIPAVGYIKADQLYLFTYDGTYWVVQMMYNTNTHTSYQLYLADAKRKAYTNLYRYQVCFTKDEEYILPANAVDNSTATTKQLTTESFDPFGPIFFYNATTTVAANGVTAGSTLYFATDAADLRYAFNTGTSLVANKQVYLKCSPQSDGKVKMASNPIVQALPTTEDGYVYILLGVAYDNYRICFYATKPIYHCINGEIREWTNAPLVPSGGSSGQVLRKQSADDYDYDWGTLDIHNVPSGGSANQVLTKNSSTNYDVSWKTPADGLPTGGSLGQVLAKKTASNYDVEWIDPPLGVKIYNIAYNSVTHTYALPDTFTNVRNLVLAGTLVILSGNGIMYYLSDSSASMLVFTSAVTDDYFVYRIEWQSSDTAIDQETELTLNNNYVPSGGTTGQFLVKKSNTNYDLQWVTVPDANGVSF